MFALGVLLWSHVLIWGILKKKKRTQFYLQVSLGRSNSPKPTAADSQRFLFFVFVFFCPRSLARIQPTQTSGRQPQKRSACRHKRSTSFSSTPVRVQSCDQSPLSITGKHHWPLDSASVLLFSFIGILRIPFLFKNVPVSNFSHFFQTPNFSPFSPVSSAFPTFQTNI